MGRRAGRVSSGSTFKGCVVAQYKKRDMRPADTVRKELEDLLRQGSNVSEALKIVGRSRSWYESQRRTDKDWAHQVDAIRRVVADPDSRQMQVGTFAEFCAQYMHRKIWPHQQNMIDVLEGRDPSWLDPSMIWEPGSRGSRRVLINIPPNHAKSMTITIEYTTYLLAKNPNLKIMIISKTQDQAKKFLYAIKQRMTHPRYAEFQLAFGPPGGVAGVSGPVVGDEGVPGRGDRGRIQGPQCRSCRHGWPDLRQPRGPLYSR